MGAVQTGSVPPEELKDDAGLRPQCRLPLPCPAVAHLELAMLSASWHQERCWKRPPCLLLGVLLSWVNRGERLVTGYRLHLCGLREWVLSHFQAGVVIWSVHAVSLKWSVDLGSGDPGTYTSYSRASASSQLSVLRLCPARIIHGNSNTSSTRVEAHGPPPLPMWDLIGKWKFIQRELK